MTQAELARRLKKTPGWMSHVILGRRRIMLADARKLADELGVNLETLVFPGDRF